MEAVIAISIAVAFLVGIFVLLFMVVGSNNRKIYKQVSKLALNFRMQGNVTPPKKWALSPYMPELYGEYDGRKLRLYFYRVGSGKNTTYWTALEIEVDNRSQQTLKIYKENFFSKIGKAFGGQDIEVGNERFDKELILKSSSEEFIKALLGPAVQEQFLRIWVERRPAGTLTLEGNVLKYVEMGLINNTARRERMEMVIILMQALAKNISEGIGQRSSDFFQ